MQESLEHISQNFKHCNGLSSRIDVAIISKPYRTQRTHEIDGDMDLRRTSGSKIHDEEDERNPHIRLLRSL